ncbi:hypothetical protein Taro_021360 [Colocasia esculenta]|uniref:Uncharacterized protein n=1 Tax=Colocasia esculenta TaxID=4460 RepID=A0A843V4R6_COLES|nr:hypothetical protein [Colocasia esculenta]
MDPGSRLSAPSLLPTHLIGKLCSFKWVHKKQQGSGGEDSLAPSSTTQYPKSEISLDILMTADSETERKQKMDVHYVISDAPYVIEENYAGYFHDNGAEMLVDFLQSQEIAYQSFQGARETGVAKASSSNTRSGHDRGQGSGSTSVGNPSRSMDFKEQLAVDEAMARELQYEEDNLAATALSGITITAAGDEGFHPVLQETSPIPPDHVATSMDISDLPIAQDGIDPDSMTYEELQSLGEAIGTENRGLSDKLISFLKTSTYRIGFFSRKDKNEE